MEKVQVGDLIRVLKDTSRRGLYKKGDILEVESVLGVAGVIAKGVDEGLFSDEYVIHRKVGSEGAPEGGATDAVNPQHYKQGRVEVIDIIEDAVEGADPFEAVCQANVLKYALRYRSKNGVEDLRKMLWYGERLVAYLEAK